MEDKDPPKKRVVKPVNFFLVPIMPHILDLQDSDGAYPEDFYEKAAKIFGRNAVLFTLD